MNAMAAITAPAFRAPMWSVRLAPAAATTRRAVPASVYRRRRLVVAALLLSTVLAGSWLLGVLGGGPLTASEAPSPTVTRLDLETVSRSTYVVGPGDTLWSIARHVQPAGDVRPVVDALAAQLGGRSLQVGETLVLP